MTPIEAAHAVLDRYPEADSAFLAGSVVRGEATPSSDLDIVMLFEHLDHAFRESFFEADWPVEVFAHDRETIEYYFLEEDRASGIGSLMWMVHDGIAIPDATPLNVAVKARALELIREGPIPWDKAALDYSRYTLTNLVDDLLDARNADEERAILTACYSVVSHHILRSRGNWSATGKMIPRRLHALDPAIASAFNTAFAAAFSGNVESLVKFVDSTLEGVGGRLFDGYRADAGTEKRLTP